MVSKKEEVKSKERVWQMTAKKAAQKIGQANALFLSLYIFDDLWEEYSIWFSYFYHHYNNFSNFSLILIRNVSTHECKVYLSSFNITKNSVVWGKFQCFISMRAKLQNRNWWRDALYLIFYCNHPYPSYLRDG